MAQPPESQKLLLVTAEVDELRTQLAASRQDQAEVHSVLEQHSQQLQALQKQFREALAEKLDAADAALTRDANKAAAETQSEDHRQVRPPSASGVAAGGDVEKADDVLRHIQEKILIGEDVCVERPSCWDAATFLCHGHMMTVAESSIIAFLVLLTLFMQYGFLGVIYTSLTVPVIDEEAIESFKFWRLSAAHRHDLVDKLQIETLASRVCREDASLYLSQQQSETVGLINAYLYDNKPFNGPLMCSLAMAAWILVVLHEAQVIFGRIRLLYHVPRGCTTFVLDGQEVRVTVLHRARAFWGAFLLCLRGVTLVLLLVAGMKFLAYTIELPELVLNAIALEFILKLDEICFVSLGPFRVRAFIKVLKPMRLPDRVQWSGIDVQVIFCFALMGLALVFSITVTLADNMHLMVRAHDAICGGQLDWVYGISQVGFPVWASLQGTLSASDSEARTQYRLLSVLASAPSFDSLSVDVLNYRAPEYAGGTWSVSSVTQWSLREISSRLNNACEDLLTEEAIASGDPIYLFHLASVQDQSQNFSTRVCADVANLCGSGDSIGVYTRIACPLTCGCRSPLSDLALATIENGCGETCLSHPDYLAERQVAPCSDTSMQDPVERASWVSLAAQMRRAFLNWPDNNGMLRVLADTVETSGCEVVPIMLERFRWNLCTSFGFIRSFAIRCPVSCGCAEEGVTFAANDECPGTCRSR